MKKIVNILVLLMAVLYNERIYCKEYISLPFVIDGNNIIVDVKSEFGCLKFIFDTGSYGSIIDSLFAREIGLCFDDSELYFTTPSGISVPSYRVDFKLWNLADFKIRVKPYYFDCWDAVNTENIFAGYKTKIFGIMGAGSFVNNNVVEIDFKNHNICICDSIDKDLSNYNIYELEPCNKSKENEFGRAFPQCPAVKCSILFNSGFSKKVDLVIDTGNRYGLAFITSDLEFINQNRDVKGKYSILGKEIGIAFSLVSIQDKLKTDFIKSPLFYSQTPKIFNNELYGLLGLPALQKYESVIIDWPNRTIYFSKKSNIVIP